MNNINLKTFNATEESNVQNAIQQGNFFFKTALNCEYKKFSSKETTSLLQNSYSLLNEESLLQLLFDEAGIPRDVYIDTTMKPSYALAAISICAYNNGNAFFENTENLKNFSQLLKACLRFKLKDHGYESEIGKLTNLLLFCKAGVKSFIEQNYPVCQSFSDFFKQEIESLKAKFGDYKTSDKDIFCFTFDPYKATAKVAQILAAYEGNVNSIFVYGTLMSPFVANKNFLTNSTFGGNFLLKNFAIYDLGSYPAIKHERNKTTYGEVWFVDDTTLHTLDSYENEGYLYKRENVTVESSHGDLDCYAYVFIDEPYGTPVAGRWNHEYDDYIWYACYGSNLSSARFTYYLKGGIYENKHYTGCSDQRLWKETQWCKVNGKMYFAKRSPRWNNGGVAFYTSKAKGQTIMRLYKITRDQLEEIKIQEGGWYDDIKYLGFAEDGYPIYTITSKKLQPQNAPSAKYSALIFKALTEEYGMTDTNASSYLNSCKL